MKNETKKIQKNPTNYLIGWSDNYHRLETKLPEQMFSASGDLVGEFILQA
jgi:hypothetical protein